MRTSAAQHRGRVLKQIGDEFIDASGAKSSFRTGESLVATIDDKTHQMKIVRNGKVEKTLPVSLGKPGYQTNNGT